MANVRGIDVANFENPDDRNFALIKIGEHVPFNRSKEANVFKTLVASS